MSISPNMSAWLVSFKHIETMQGLNTKILAGIRIYQWWVLWKCVESVCFGCLKPACSLPWFKYGPCNFFPFKSLHKPFPQIWYKVNFNPCEILTNSGFREVWIKEVLLYFVICIARFNQKQCFSIFFYLKEKNSENNKWHLIALQHRATSWNYVRQTSKNLFEDTFLNAGPNICS